MLWKILKPTVFLALFVMIAGLSVVAIRHDAIIMSGKDEKVCGVVTRLAGRINSERWVAIVNDGKLIVQVPTSQAYSRLMVGKEFTFIYRGAELIAIADGNQCNK